VERAAATSGHPVEIRTVSAEYFATLRKPLDDLASRLAALAGVLGSEESPVPGVAYCR